MKPKLYSKIIKYLYYTLFFIVPFIVYPATSELFEFNKMLFIYAMAACIGWFWLMRSIQEKRFVFRRTVFDIPLLIFMVSQVLSTVFSIDTSTSLFGYYGRFNGGLISLFTYIFLYYAFVSNLSDELSHIIRSLFKISVVSSFLVILWGLPGKFGHDLSCLLFTSKFDNTCWTTQFRPSERMFSTLGQPNWLGAYLAVTFFMGLYLFFTSSQNKKWLYGSFIVLNYIGILFTRSRSALGSLIPGFIVLIILYFVKEVKKDTQKKPYFKTLGILMGGMIVATFIFKTGIPQADYLLEFRFLNTNSKKAVVASVPSNNTTPSIGSGITESFDIRKIVWKGAVQLGEQYPLFGTGVETFGYSYYSVRPVAHNLTSEWDYLYNKAHNEYLNFFATTGWFGLISVILFIVWGYAYLVKQIFLHKKDDALLYLYISLGSIWLSIIITNFFGFSITVINLYWYIIPAFLLTSSPVYTTKTKENKMPVLGYILPFIVWVYMMNSLFSYWLADYKYATSDAALKSNNIEAAASLLYQALALRHEHVYEDKLSYTLSQLAFYSSYQKQADQAKKYMSESERLNLASIQESSQNILYWKTRVKNQYLFYQMTLDKKYLFTGLSALDEAAKLGPTDPKIPYFAATYYALLFDEEKNVQQKKIYEGKAFEAINHAISMKTDYGDAYYLKIQLEKKFGKKTEAKQLLEWYIPHFSPQNPELLKELGEM